MKIKKASIHAFGKFIDRTFCFSPGINLIYGENEAGKTTLGEFIFNMFYGQKIWHQRGFIHRPTIGIFLGIILHIRESFNTPLEM